MEYYKNIRPPIGRIGITQYEHMHGPDEKRTYFSKAGAANATRKAIFRQSGDLLEEVIATLQGAWREPVGIAVEDTGEQYFAGLVRDIPVALLHRDWAPRDARGWAVGQISAQLTWNVYLQTSRSGGALVIYRRPYQESDECAKLAADNCAFSAAMVQDCDLVEILPAPGELILFNARNYHEVRSTEGTIPRITASSFIGQMPGGGLALWS
jgi:carrier-protein-independent halogenase WelO5-like protein